MPEPGAIAIERFDAGNDRVFQLAVDHAPIGIAVVAIDGTWLRVNAALCRILGRDERDLMASSFQEISHPDDLEADLALLAATLDGRRSGYQIEKRYLRPDGSVVWTQLDVELVRDDDGPRYFISQVQDIGARKEDEARMRHMALHDELTDLPNRVVFVDRLEHALRRRRPPDSLLAVGFLDLDDFKFINDTAGHPVGDRVLVEVADRLRAQLRAGDTVARFGGDEFALIFDGIIHVEAARGLAERVVTALRAPVPIGLEHHTVSASIGVVVADERSTVADLLRHADLAMYSAKADGKDRVALFDAALERDVRNRMDTERDIRAGLGRGEFVPAYQPVVGLGDGATIGYEMLARWDRPDVGLVAAGSFIATATRARLLCHITSQLLAAVAGHHAALLTDEEAFLNVNVTPEVLGNEAISDRLAGLAGELRAPGQLVLEITESEVLHLDGASAAALARLRSLGLQLAIDDFGTGYSSLAMLADLHPEILKIDMSFTHRLHEVAPAAIVGALCRMARDLEIVTIGEGVETEEQAEQLAALGCDAGQGYLWAPARRIGEVAAR